MKCLYYHTSKQRHCDLTATNVQEMTYCKAMVSWPNQLNGYCHAATRYLEKNKMMPLPQFVLSDIHVMLQICIYYMTNNRIDVIKKELIRKQSRQLSKGSQKSNIQFITWQLKKCQQVHGILQTVPKSKWFYIFKFLQNK